MSNVTRKTDKNVATVNAESRKVRVTVTESLTIAESRELRGLLKEAEKKAEAQREGLGGFINFPGFAPYRTGQFVV